MRRSSNAFTLAELLVSVAVLTILVLIATRMINSAATVTTLGSKRMDTDSQVRPVLDRMAADFAQMIRRADVDYFVKSGDQAGNDQIAFFSMVAGYYPPTGSQSPLSLVAYRINADTSSSSFNRMQRMGKGLIWSSVSPTPAASPLPSPNPPWIIFGGSPTLQTNWPSATVSDPSNQNYKDPDYELVAPQVFRFEYFYLLNTGAVSDSPGAAGMQDVAAIVVTVAAIDQKTRALLTDAQVSTLSGRLKDFDVTKPIHDLTTSWQAALDAVADMPRVAISGIRMYQRYFYLSASR
jgi:prepilin-type N-terminal cleavage/methylation domain-containing protein